jgi:secretory phospholipase A2
VGTVEYLHDRVTFFLGYSNDPWGTSSKMLEAESQLLQAPLEEEESESGQSAKRRKRGVLHLYNMVLCATGCDPLAFKGYGCYCGFLGSGYTVDGIDR